MGSNDKTIVPGSNYQVGVLKIFEANYNFKPFNRLIEEELTGLNMDERERRCGPGVYEFMKIEGGIRLPSTEIAFYRTDCATKLELSRVGESSNNSSSL